MDLAGDVTVGVSSPDDLAGDVTIGVSSPADIAGDVTVGVLSPADLAGDITVGVSTPAHLDKDIAVGVSSPANLAGGVTVGVAPSAIAGVASSAAAGVASPADIAEVASSADLAEVASSADLAEVASLADLAGCVTVGVTSTLLVLSSPVWRSRGSVMFRVVWCVIMMTIFMMDIMTRTQTIFTPGDFDSYPDVYGFIEPDDYELYHDLHGADDCRVYCVSRGDAGVTPYWTGVEDCDIYGGDIYGSRLLVSVDHGDG